METTAHNTGNVGEMVKNLPAIVFQPVTGRLAKWSPMISVSSDPFTKHLAGKRYAQDTDNKQDVIYWLQTLGTDFFYYNSRTSNGAML
jgi:hypothetical protein